MAPKLPKRTGRTARLVQRLVQRRKDLGWSQEELARRLVERAQAMAAEFGEEPLWESLSGSYIGRWERMFNADADAKTKRTRLTMSIAAYGMWARVLGMRMFVDYVDEDSPREHVLLMPEEAEIARKVRGLPEAQRHVVEQLVNDLWRSYADPDAVDHDF